MDEYDDQPAEKDDLVKPEKALRKLRKNEKALSKMEFGYLLPKKLNFEMQKAWGAYLPVIPVQTAPMRRMKQTG